MKTLFLILISLILVSCETLEEKELRAIKEDIDYQSSLTIQDLIDFAEKISQK